jgi:hypothetical protein
MINVLRQRLINPNATHNVCKHLQEYTYILDIFQNLDSLITIDIFDNLENITYLIGIFFIIDRDITVKSYSKLDLTTFIIDKNDVAIKINNIKQHLQVTNDDDDGVC